MPLDLTVHLFGSSVNGFGSRTSDADYSVLTLGIRVRCLDYILVV